MKDIAYNLSNMSNYFKIISIAALFLAAVISAGPVFAEHVGTIKGDRPSWYAVIKTENEGKKLYVKGDIFSPTRLLQETSFCHHSSY